MTDHTYFVSGKVYARTYGAQAAFEWPGLIDTVSLAIAQNIISLPDRTTPGGGVYKEIRRIESVAMTLNHREFKPATLAQAMYGTSTEVVAGSAANESHFSELGMFIPFDHPGPYENVVVNDGDPSDPLVLEATDYEVRPAGIAINADAAEAFDGAVIVVAYDYPLYHRIQALTSSPPELELFFEGLNEADDDSPAPARFHRVRFGPAEEWQLLSGDDFGALSLSGQVLKDLTKTDTGISQFFYSDVIKTAVA